MRPRPQTRSPLALLIGLWLAAASGLVACAGTSSGTNPHDMSYEEHLAAAEDADSRYEYHEQQADVVEPARQGYHRGQAIEYQHHAQAHREAAEALRTDEVATCQSAPDEARATCPLTGDLPIEEIREIPNGVEIRFGAGADPALIESSVACHRAHAAYLGFEGMDDCPFYLRDISVNTTQVEGVPVLQITSTDPDVANQIRQRTLGTDGTTAAWQRSMSWPAELR